MPRWRVMKSVSMAAPAATSRRCSSTRMRLIRSRMPASSSSHIARSAGVDSTVVIAAAPCVGGFE